MDDNWGEVNEISNTCVRKVSFNSVQVPGRYTPILVISIHDTINSRDCFLRRFGDHNFKKKLPFVDITHILYSVDSHARRGLVTSHMWL